MHDTIDSGAPVRMFALVPFDIGRTMSLGLGQSGGKALVTFAPNKYNFVFFSHWFGGSARRRQNSRWRPLPPRASNVGVPTSGGYLPALPGCT